jgi:hypothetical protein
MAIILLEEVLMGLDETREALDHAVVTLENILDDLSPDLQEDFHDTFEQELLKPLQSRRDMIDHLLYTLAEETEEAGA